MAWHETTAAGALASVLKTMDFVGLVFLATAQVCVFMFIARTQGLLHSGQVLTTEPCPDPCLVLTDFYTNTILKSWQGAKIRVKTNLDERSPSTWMSLTTMTKETGPMKLQMK